VTALACPRSTRSAAPVATSQTRIVASTEPDTALPRHAHTEYTCGD
jgi:hypothetical protein